VQSTSNGDVVRRVQDLHVADLDAILRHDEDPLFLRLHLLHLRECLVALENHPEDRVPTEAKMPIETQGVRLRG